MGAPLDGDATDSAEAADRIVERSDAALYQAKRYGRNRVGLKQDSGRHSFAAGEIHTEGLVDLLVNLDVDNLENVIGFYSTVFDLRVGRRFGAGAAEMLGSSAPIYLLAKAAGTPVSSATTERRSYERHWTPVHLDFVVGDIESAVERAISAGALFEGPIATHKWGRLALMADPFGHGFCFVQFLGAGYDEIAE